MIARFSHLLLLRPRKRVIHSNPIRVVRIWVLSVGRNFVFRQFVTELEKKSKYWFFRTHHQLVPLVHCVARAVSANAVSGVVSNAAQTQHMSHNPELLGMALAHAKVFIRETVPKALSLLVPAACEGLHAIVCFVSTFISFSIFQ